MKTEQQMRDTIIRKATRAAGVSRRDVRDCFHQEDRAPAVALMDRMIAAGELFECIREHSGRGIPQRRVFVERGDGSKWAAGLVQETQKAKREPRRQPTAPSFVVGATAKRLDRDGVAVGDMPAPTVWETPPGRFEVRGTVPRVTSAAECRPWAAAAAARASA